MKHYEAIRMDDTISGGRTSGILTVSWDHIKFDAEDQHMTIPLGQLTITSGGAGNRLIFLTHSGKEKMTLYTSDHSILKEEAFRNHPHLKEQLKSSKKGLGKVRFSLAYVIAFVVLLIVGLYFSKDYLIRKLAEQVPVSWEKKAGDQLFAAISSEYDIIQNDSLKKVFLKVAAPLIDQVQQQGVKVDLYFVKDPSINAFALPGGKVVIQTGLIDNANSWEEVLGVMGHELAHVTERHHLRGILNNLGLYAIISASVGDVSAIAGTLANMGTNLASLSGSRKFENEADERGWEYLVAGKINPRGMISFFETLEKENGSDHAAYLSFLSTHPDTKERIAHLKKKLKKNHQEFAPVDNDFTAFKKAFNQYK